MASLPGNIATAQWSSRFAFIMAAVGSSVGLGNLWRFSAEAGENGGGAFILVYLACVVFVGIPVLMSEFLVGRAGNASSAVLSVEDVAARSGVSKRWSGFAWIGMVAAFLIVSFYCVVAAWVIMYIPKFLFGAFDGQTAEQIGAQFSRDAIGTAEDGSRIIGSQLKVLLYFTLFAALTVYLVSRGVNKGIEATSKILMPIFFVLLILLCCYSVYYGNTVKLADGQSGTQKAWTFMFSPDFSKLSPITATKALGQAFFSIGIGSAIMITYGSYLPKHIRIPRVAILVALTDTFVAIIAGLAIFPIVFSHGLDVASGAGLFFATLPVAISDLPFGRIIGAAFFFLAFFAAITSSISLFEPAVSYAAEKLGWSRKQAAVRLGALLWAIGACCVFSIGTLDRIDGFTGTVMLPLSGLLLVIFTGWRLKRSIIAQETQTSPAWLTQSLLALVRYVAPICIFLILALGVMEKYLPAMYKALIGG